MVASTTSTDSRKPSALDGCKVLEIGRFVTGPYAAQLLADLGAEVIKIEDPKGGDPFRGWGRAGWDGYGAPFLGFNRNKKSLTLDLKDARARELFKKLAQDADVFIENFRPGVAEKLGIGYDILSAANPRLIYCSVTGMGSDGPYAQRPSYDIVGQGLSGLLSLLVDVKNPRPMGPAFADALTGLYAAYGILGALHAREKTGRGQRVETSLVQGTMAFMNEPFSGLFANGKVPDAFDRPRASGVFCFVCGDRKPIAIHLSSPNKFWVAFATAAGHPELLEDARFKVHSGRHQHADVIQQTLAPEFSKKPRAEWTRILEAADVPFAPIYTLDEVIEDPQVQHLGMVQKTSHHERGEVRTLGYPVKLSETPLGPVSAPSTLGEHSDEILASLGVAGDEIARLRARGVI
ncbi:MAG: CoA transferase [Betaproteobacteria bacterium]|nr:CoA transferase [Betaproteobacteria bacterium]